MIANDFWKTITFTGSVLLEKLEVCCLFVLFNLVVHPDLLQKN